VTGGVALVAVAAGVSRRMGEIDKVWADLDGEPVLAHSLRTLGTVCDEVVLVVRAGKEEQARALASTLGIPTTVVTGGAERQESVERGLRAVVTSASVAIHDCARPFASVEMLEQGLTLLVAWHGAVPAVPPADTIKRVAADGRVEETLDRAELRAAQTPQLFRTESIVRAHAAALASRQRGTDDASLLEAIDLSVCTFPGSQLAFKITTPLDLELARQVARTRTPAR
jgi:2-C-methyl-D-erythritol 4-phosphate cytidylyltransferase